MFDYKLWYSITRDEEIGINIFVEYIIRMIYSSIVSVGDLVIDGGANRGMHTVPLSSSVGQTGSVIAVEAVPVLATELAKKVSDIRQIGVLNSALGASIGRTSFTYVNKAHTRSGIREQEGLSDELKGSIHRIEIDLTTIDHEVMSRISDQKMRFIKLDLEGGEFDALRGSKSVMSTFKPMIILENGAEKSARVYGYTKLDFFALFSDLKYSLFDVFGREYGQDLWARPYIPPYIAAASRAEDIMFLRNRLPNLISTLCLPYLALKKTKAS